MSKNYIQEQFSQKRNFHFFQNMFPNLGKRFWFHLQSHSFIKWIFHFVLIYF